MNIDKGVIIRLAIMVLSFSIIFAVFLQFMTSRSSDSENNEGGNEPMYLSDMDWNSATNDPTKDISRDDEKIILKNNNHELIEFEKGISMKANSEIIYDLSDLNYKYLTAWVGVNDGSNDNSSLQLQIFADDTLKYESKSGQKAMTHSTPMEYVNIDISETDMLKLVVKQVDQEQEGEISHAEFGDIQLHVENPVVRNSNDIPEYEGMTLIFNDEFDGDEIDSEKWQLSTVPENGSHQYANVVGKDENIWQEDGNLIIQAKKYEGNEEYKTTSASLMSEDLFDFRYGRVDVRAKIPAETGMWPAIWMMPQDADYGWPMAGEIDIMELVSQEPNKIYSTIHSGVYNTPYYNNPGGTLRIKDGTFHDDYHTYTMIWEPGVFSFFVDDELVGELSNWENHVTEVGSDAKTKRDYPTPFDKNFYFKLNLATGGGWSEDVDESTRFGDRTSLKFDYIRVYQEDKPAYNYATDEHYQNKNQGAVWYTQKLKDKTWENFEEYDSELERWISVSKEAEEEQNKSAFVSIDGISANFDSDYSAAAIAFRAPYKGYLKVSLQDNPILDNDFDVTFKITKGDLTATQSDEIKTEVFTKESDNILETETYLTIEADEFIRFEIMQSDNEVTQFVPVVEYIDEEEYQASR